MTHYRPVLADGVTGEANYYRSLLITESRLLFPEADTSGVLFEVLNFPFVIFCCFERIKSAQISAFLRFFVGLF